METTTYYCRVLKNDWQRALDILADIFTGSVLDPEELERERDVILQEIAAANDQPDDLARSIWPRQLLQQSPAARSILGTSELIGGVSRDQMLAYDTVTGAPAWWWRPKNRSPRTRAEAERLLAASAWEPNRNANS
jgi:predicted Zn-dependent peptidase